MSKGHGGIQRRALEVLQQQTSPLMSLDVAGIIFDKRVLSYAEVSSVRRALRKLAAEGLVKNLGRDFHYGRRGWATPEVAEQYIVRVGEFFGSKAAAGHRNANR